MMTTRNQNNIFLLLCLLVILGVMSPRCVCIPAFPGKSEGSVSILNMVTSELTVQCKAKGVDLGSKKIGVQEEYRFKFKLDLFGNTLYFCNFNWGTKHAVFDVYTTSLSETKCSRGIITSCDWFVKPDGFYISGDTAKMHDWA